MFFKMKKRELKELRTKTREELEKLIRELRLELANLRLAKYAGKIKDVNLLKKKSDYLAYLETIKKEKELTNENS